MSGAITFEFVGAVVAALMISGAVFGWVFRQMAKRDKAIADLKLHIAENYVTKSGLTESLNRVDSSVNRLTSRIDELTRLFKANP